MLETFIISHHRVDGIGFSDACPSNSGKGGRVAGERVELNASAPRAKDPLPPQYLLGGKYPGMSVWKVNVAKVENQKSTKERVRSNHSERK